MKPFNRRYALVLVLTVALVASLTTNILTSLRSQLYLDLYQQVILDPMGMDYYLPRDKPEVPQGKELVVLLGDSRALVWPAPDSDRFVFANRGVSGQTSAQVLGRFADDIYPLHPDIIIIQVGVNDLTAIPAFPNHQARILARCKENIRELTGQAAALDATVILTTIFPVGKSIFPWEAAEIAEVASAVEEVNQFIHSLAGEHVIVMDTGEILADSIGYLKPEFSQDTVHLNERGYQALNVALSSILESIPDGGQ